MEPGSGRGLGWWSDVVAREKGRTVKKRRICKKHRKVTITMARNLYVLALQCRAEACGMESIRDPVFEDTHTTYQQTWFLLAERLVKKGWRPPPRQLEMPPQQPKTP
jgi:hypothetical protein